MGQGERGENEDGAGRILIERRLRPCCSCFELSVVEESVVCSASRYMFFVRISTWTLPSLDGTKYSWSERNQISSTKVLASRLTVIDTPCLTDTPWRITHDNMANRSTAQVALLTTGALLTGALGYALYFDYQRRHNPEFRKSISE